MTVEKKLYLVGICYVSDASTPNKVGINANNILADQIDVSLIMATTSFHW